MGKCLINRPLADFAPTIILKAKDFAAEDVKKVERRLASERKKSLKEPGSL